MRFSAYRSPAVLLIGLFLCVNGASTAQSAASRSGELRGRVELHTPAQSKDHAAVVLWLTSVDDTSRLTSPPPGRFTLVQKNRKFEPSLLVIPTGSTVIFPNQDPFFHNVFSLFNGKRFDLGLYEAGSSREVVFQREGVSYIFCNIHPEMSAVIIALSTPFHAIADASRTFTISGVPAGGYDLHTWIEGMQQPVNDGLTRRVHISAGEPTNVVVDAHIPPSTKEHLNKFGKPYERDVNPY